ncbi:type 2 periplasmic-binding domain-containing protein [Azospirillum canadense]|uniref:hypothetical protein n=1 Tax=Azospirillum canadense TaxID=403962 RepID=UPI002226248B|nr:hypothetical protein [Azospirillum canadense]MCW2240599.1 DNA-binding transcriptional LysR family regulator [Azospirillum canadense]
MSILPGEAHHAATRRHADTGEAFQRPVTGTMTFNNNDAVIEAGLAGAGLEQLHTYMAEPHLKSGALTQVLSSTLAI